MSIHWGGRSICSAWPKAPLPAWDIADLGVKLLGRIDAENAGSLTLTGTAVDAWADTVASVSFVQAVAGSKPTYSATSFGGRPGVTFDGTADELSYAGVPYPAAADPCEIWIACSNDAVASGRTAFGYGNVANTSRLVGFRLQGGVLPYIPNLIVGSGAANTSIDAPGNGSGVHVLRAQVGAASTTASMDGAAGTPGAVVPATATTKSTIGGRPSAVVTTFFLGVINCIIITDPLTDAEALQLLAYLGKRCVP